MAGDREGAQGSGKTEAVAAVLFVTGFLYGIGGLLVARVGTSTDEVNWVVAGVGLTLLAVAGLHVLMASFIMLGRDLSR